jgi:hypothetical protein
VADEKHPEFGGSISVRARSAEKPIIIFGQDEAIFNQNSSNTFQWVGPNGERPLLPKSSGMGKMISVFQSRVTGWGVDLSEEDLQRINNRQMNQRYHDAEAAQVLYGSTLKGKLTATPFVRVFEFGGTNGYWTGNHTIIQVEDCKDCLDLIFGDKFLFVLLFDHSSGHAKKEAMD